MSWPALRDLFPRNPRGAEATEHLTAAYRDVFSGNATKGQAQAVLVDLADYSGFYQCNALGSDLVDYAESNGKRIMFGRIFRFLNLSEEELRQLQEAARQETIANQNHGEI